jgi:tryptophan halogenase
MEILYPVMADAFRLARQGRGVAIEFGRIDGAPVESGPSTIIVKDRVTISLETARRMIVWLDEALEQHEVNLKAEDAKGLAPAAAAVATRPGQNSPRPPQDTSGTTAARLLRMIGAWGIPHQYERSLRLSEGSLQANRFLLTVNTRDIPGDPAGQTLAVCEQFAMPPAMRQAAADNFAMAKCVHFGFEGDPDSIICKLYLEADVTRDDARNARAAGRPVLMHLAFKWDLLRDAAVTTRYLWHPGLRTTEIEARLANIYRDGQTESREIARALLRLAVERVAPESLQWLEVEEVENERRSFDLNIYNTKLQIKDIYDLLQQIRVHFGIRPGQFQALYDQIKGLALGHLAGGIHRNGKDFFNLYYGAVGLPHFNEKLN